ncbi:aspartyl aminopeptidase [Moniliophthora roreri MCA 2997]|uniref:aspartyl aminopeptidase n=1 Tax=Moniliophthora roreri (strain MCA 2997) TaxID=1381753 RepID=V2XYT5_MONRO|nr:aspartyl aminopeptidase [Moniliophthora roreri MCA 2997]
MTTMRSELTIAAATRLINFVNASPTPFHAVHNASQLLDKAGFRKLKESDSWDKELESGGKYYFTRNQSCLIAFTLPHQWKIGTGLSIVATHVDSPNLRVRPISKREKVGYLQVSIETYGGGIWHSWFDRDLSLAGRVVTADKTGKFASRLVKIDRPVLRVPTLAIHLDRSVDVSFAFNQETEFIPILGLAASQLNTPTEAPKKTATSIQDNHHSALLSLLSEELSVAPEEIHDFELHLYDVQPACLGGINNEFIFAPRMDNQFSSYCAVEALINTASSNLFPTLEGNVNAIALFNHEEVGSVSSTGAEANLIPSLLSRLSPTPETLAQSIDRSFLLSCDMGHAVHPNYSSKHEDNHRPHINAGMVIKTNAKQRYASDAISSFIVKKLIEKKGGQVQEFEVRNDMACGSTVGPPLSTIGMKTVDVGAPMLSMHSIRETAGSSDVQNCIDLFESLFEGYASLDKNLTVD